MVYQILHFLYHRETNCKKKGLYTSLPTLNGPWESISMDYMLGLPSTNHGNDCVFVVVDHFSKMAILIAFKKSVCAEDIAKILFKHDWFHFGLLKTIESDRYTIF